MGQASKKSQNSSNLPPIGSNNGMTLASLKEKSKPKSYQLG